MNYTVTPVITMIYMVTANITSYDRYYYRNYYILTIYIVTAPTTPLWTILLQQLLRLWSTWLQNYHVLQSFCPSNYVLWLILLQLITSPWSIYPANVRHVQIAATGGPPPDAPYQERPGGRHAKHPRLCHLCYHIVFFCFAICVIRYLPNWRP